MDQAALTNQILLRYQRERSEDSNLDRRLDLCAGGHRPQTGSSSIHTSLFRKAGSGRMRPKTSSAFSNRKKLECQVSRSATISCMDIGTQQPDSNGTVPSASQLRFRPVVRRAAH